MTEQGSKQALPQRPNQPPRISHATLTTAAISLEAEAIRFRNLGLVNLSITYLDACNEIRAALGLPPSQVQI